jgi:hypothetical protein
MSRKFDINSLNVVSFLEWVKRQDPDKTYNYMNVSDCPVISFARSLGYEGSWIALASSHFDQVVPLDALVVTAGINPLGQVRYGQLAAHLEEATR